MEKKQNTLVVVEDRCASSETVKRRSLSVQSDRQILKF